MSETCTAEQRALQLEAEIMKLVETGEIELTNGVYAEGTSEVCHACALGAAVRAICGVKETFSLNFGGGWGMATRSNDLRLKLVARGVATYDEIIRMEAGFEDFPRRWVVGDRGVRWSTKDPFYKLGQRLAERVE